MFQFVRSVSLGVSVDLQRCAVRTEPITSDQDEACLRPLDIGKLPTMTALSFLARCEVMDGVSRERRLSRPSGRMFDQTVALNLVEAGRGPLTDGHPFTLAIHLINQV